MPGSKIIKSDFYTIASEKYDALNITDILDAIISNYPSHSDRNYECDGDFWRLQSWEKKDTCYEGLFIRLRRSAEAKYAALDSDIYDYVPLEPNQCLCESICFLYFPATNTFVSERNRFAGTGTKFVEYIEDKSRITPLECRFRYNSDAWQKLMSMDYVKKVDIKFEMVKNSKIYDGTDLSLGDVARIKKMPGMKYVTLGFSAGPGNQPLWHQVKDFVKSIAGLDKYLKIRTLSVTGKDEDTTSYILDLIADRMKYDETINYKERHLPLKIIWAALYNAHDKMYAELKRQNE